jgi:hypothetical protein
MSVEFFGLKFQGAASEKTERVDYKLVCGRRSALFSFVRSCAESAGPKPRDPETLKRQGSLSLSPIDDLE